MTLQTDPDSPNIFETHPELREIVLTKLTQALGDPDPQVRRIAALNLGRVGDEAVRAVPALANMLSDDPDPELRQLAAFILSGLGERTLPFLLHALASRSPETVNAAITGLAGQTVPPRDWMPALMRVTTDDDSFYRYQAVTALFTVLDRRVPDEYIHFDETTYERGLKAFRVALVDSDEGVRLVAAYALWILYRDTSGVEIIAEASQRPDHPHQELALKMHKAVQIGMENE